eukprot:1158139-Pelagomonas_calceolata.AAC.15
MGRCRPDTSGKTLYPPLPQPLLTQARSSYLRTAIICFSIPAFENAQAHATKQQTDAHMQAFPGQEEAPSSQDHATGLHCCSCCGLMLISSASSLACLARMATLVVFHLQRRATSVQKDDVPPAAQGRGACKGCKGGAFPAVQGNRRARMVFLLLQSTHARIVFHLQRKACKDGVTGVPLQGLCSTCGAGQQASGV